MDKYIATALVILLTVVIGITVFGSSGKVAGALNSLFNETTNQINEITSD